MAEPFEHISKGMDLVLEGNYSQAEKRMLQGIREYIKLKDVDGLGFALGRLGDCYEQSGDIDKAINSYERAVQLGTDIPAIYSALIDIYIKKFDFDRAFELADLWQQNGSQHISYPPQEIFISSSSSLSRNGNHKEAITLLERTIECFPQESYPIQYWTIRGRLGYVHEQAGDLEVALKIYSDAVNDGSTDKFTFTRYLINLEKQKNYKRAKQVIKKGLEVQSEAAWEADLKKRQQRIERKLGEKSKDEQAIIPDFSIRKGEKNITLTQQIKCSPQLRCMTSIDRNLFGVTGGKSPKLFSQKFGSEVKDWEVELPETPNGILTTSSHIILHSRSGKVGEGETHLYFLTSSGQPIAQQRLPDVPTEIVLGGNQIYAGCRDGKLYAFNSQGKALWSYSTPGSKDEQDNEYSRPCPYYVSGGEDVVAFSSFQNVYVLNNRGKLLYQWNTPEEKSTRRSEGVTFTITTGPSSIRALSVLPKGRELLVGSDDTLFYLVDGKIQKKIKPRMKWIRQIVVEPTGLWGITGDDKVLVLEKAKTVGRFSLSGYGRVQFNRHANRLIAWSGKNMVVATASGKPIAELEFVKDVHYAECLDDGKIILGTRYVILLDTYAVQSMQKVISIPTAQIKAGRDDEFVQSTLVSRPTEEDNIPINWIEGEKITISGKAYYKSTSGREITIEYLVLDYYKKQGYQGIWTENAYWWEIMTLLFWDVIYAKLPGVYTPQFGNFPSKMQDMPQDMFKSEFYLRRKKLIKERIKELTSPKMFGIVKPNIENELRSAYRQHYRKPCRPIENWEKYSINDLVLAVKALSDNQLFLVLQRLLQNFNENRRGMPDLFLISNSGNPQFVEVKSEREKVAQHQLTWLSFINKKVGAPVEICRVIDK